MAEEPEWLRLNRANWDERAGVHLAPGGYDLSALRAGAGRLTPIEEAELPDPAEKRIVHLQCHIGSDTLVLAQRGAAQVTGLDFSAFAIEAARLLAGELALSERTHFVQANLYDALVAIPQPHSLDLVFVNWGAICWLPDIRRWATIVAALLRDGGSLYLAEGHPIAAVHDDAVGKEGRPGWFAPYFGRGPLVIAAAADYVNPDARLRNATTHEWIHPLSTVVSALIEADLSLEWLHEHDAVPWRMFAGLVKSNDGLYRWPDKPWLPLGFSLLATKKPGKPP
jgi:SAM-dependent methyltransferase